MKIHEYIPTYTEYRAILRRLKACGKLMNFHQAMHSDRFVILRHDVEYSIRKAVEMARIEQQEEVRATYFIQIGSPAYNALCSENIDMMREIVALGHEIGLHYRQPDEMQQPDHEAAIRRQLSILGSELGMNLDLYSVHIPKNETEYDRYRVPSALNAYGNHFFHRFGRATKPVLYISDSELKWNYGYPDSDTLRRENRIQILIHPYGWSDERRTPMGTFKMLTQTKMAEIHVCFMNEFHPYIELLKGTIQE